MDEVMKVSCLDDFPILLDVDVALHQLCAYAFERVVG